MRLTIPYESTEGAVLAVPIGALMQSTDGTTRVQIESSNEAPEYVEVQEGLGAQGFVEVTPLNGKLEPGQRVVVGYERSAEELFSSSDLGL